MRVITNMQGVKYFGGKNELSNSEVLQQCRKLDGHDPITGKKLDASEKSKQQNTGTNAQ